MDEHFFRIAELIDFYLNNTLSSEEKKELNVWIEKYPVIQEWLDNKEINQEEIHKRLGHYEAIDLWNDWENIDAKATKSKHNYKNWGWVAAASIAVILSLTLWFNQRTSILNQNSLTTVQDSSSVKPAGYLAFLSLSNGQSISLGAKQNGYIQAGNTKVKITDNVLDYSYEKHKESAMQTLSVPRGGTYQLKLSDSTKVWLNAESEIKFPSTFSSTQRVVQVKGEAFFEIAQDANRPFKVKAEGTIIDVLGTSFNINTHLKKNLVKTILTEGKIKITTGDESQVIKPGYAAYSQNDEIKVKKADMEEALAWRDGYFYFNGKNIKEILAEISRWYKVDIDVKTTLDTVTYKGGIKRTEDIAAVCHVLEFLTGYDLKIENKTLVINK